MHPTTRLAQDGNGLWEIRYTLRGADGIARGRKARTYTTDKDKAEAYRLQWLKTWDNATDTLSSPTVSEIIDAYLKDAGKRGIRNSQDYSLVPVRKKLGFYQPQDLSGNPIKKYTEERQDVVADATVRRELGALIAAIHWASKPQLGNLIKKDQVPEILLPAGRTIEKRFLLEEQEEEFLEAALKWRLERIGRYVALGLNTGMRKEALQQLTWDRVDLRAGRINFKVPGMKETKKRRVVAPINDRLRPVLEAVPVGERVGRVVADGDIRTAFETFVATTNYPWVTSHIMRHTFISLNLRAGVLVWEVAQLVGDTAEIIEEYYGHHQSDWKLQAAANKRYATK